MLHEINANFKKKSVNLRHVNFYHLPKILSHVLCYALVKEHFSL